MAMISVSYSTCNHKMCFISLHFLSKEIAQGRVFGGSTRMSDDGDLKEVSILESGHKQIFPNDGPNKVVLKIDTGENSISNSVHTKLINFIFSTFEREKKIYKCLCQRLFCFRMEINTNGFRQ